MLANGSMSTTRKEELEIRQNIVQAGLVDCIVSMPTNLFYNVTIPVCLWFLSRQKTNRKDKILFIDARKMGFMETRIHRELYPEEIKKICTTYKAWKNGDGYEDEIGYCKSVDIATVASNGYLLTPGRYVGIADQAEEDEPFAEKIERLTSEINSLFAEARKIEDQIKDNLKDL